MALHPGGLPFVRSVGLGGSASVLCFNVSALINDAYCTVVRIKLTDTGQELRTVPDIQKPNKLLFAFYREANRGSERLSDLANPTEDYEIECGAARGPVKLTAKAQGVGGRGCPPPRLNFPQCFSF